MPPGDPIDPRALLRPGCLAHLEHLAETGSTMDRARELGTGVPLPAAVVADVQVAGRGRSAARWWQPPGSLAVSIVIDASPGSDAGPAKPAWSLACGIALVETLRDLVPGVATLVRWPNDIEVGGRKLAGILVESSGCETAAARVIFGVGVNTTGTAADAPGRLAHRVATIPDLTGAPLGRQHLLTQFVPRLRSLLAALARGDDRLVDRYAPVCGLTGREVTLYSGRDVHVGTCLGVTDEGAIVLATAGGTRAFRSGSLTRPGDEWRGAGAN